MIAATASASLIKSRSKTMIERVLGSIMRFCVRQRSVREIRKKDIGKVFRLTLDDDIPGLRETTYCQILQNGRLLYQYESGDIYQEKVSDADWPIKLGSHPNLIGKIAIAVMAMHRINKIELIRPSDDPDCRL